MELLLHNMVIKTTVINHEKKYENEKNYFYDYSCGCFQRC